MQKFLYLRIAAIIMLVAMLTYLIFIIIYSVKQLTTSDWWILVLNLAVISLLAGHSGMVLFVYHKYYPDTDLDPVHLTWYRVLTFLCWIINAICLLSIIVTMIIEKSENHDVVLYLFLFVIVLTVQLLGARRMRKTIQRNAYRHLETSFS